MSVLIKGMEMPKNCLECRLRDCDYGDCYADAEGRYGNEFICKPSWCPLEEVEE